MKNFSVYSLMLWSNKTGADHDKKISLEANENFGGEFVISTRVAGDKSAKFEEVLKVPFDIDIDAPKLGRKLFGKAAKTIQSNTFKMRDMTQDTILCDYARLLSKEMYVLRVTGFVKIKDGKPNRFTKISIHKMKDWDDFKSQQKNGRNGACGYSKESVVFETFLPVYGDVDNSFYPEDIEILENFASKLDVMFRNESAYGDYRKRVYDFKYGNNQSNDEEVAEDISNVNSSSNQSSDDPFPF